MIRAAPLLFAALVLIAWQGAVWWWQIPAYLLPGPLAIVRAFTADAAGLLAALVATLAVTGAALILATVAGVMLAVAMQASGWARAAIQPWTVVVQVTPVVAIAPLIIAWIGNPFAALVVCAAIVAFFPVFAGTAAGLASPPGALVDLFELYGASRRDVLLRLRLPHALPSALHGLRISGGLALVGAVVAEFVAGSGGFASGLAYRILEAGYRLQIPRMFAALMLLAATGVAISLALSALERAAIRE